MSLINDALKRAKDAQKSPPAASGLEFKTAAPAPAQKRGMGLMVPLVLAVFAIIGLLFVWKNQHKTAAREIPPAPAPAPVNAIVETKPAVPVVAVTTPPPAAPVAPAPAAPAAPVVSAPAPQLKLQAIFYAPGHSSAIISGKTVRVGNVFKGYRVAAITEVSTTLVSPTQTNVMTLEQ